MCVRHPLDRLVSCWAFFCGNELEIAGQGMFRDVGYCYGMNFDDFLAIALERHAENQHTRSQVDFIGPYPLDCPYLTRPLLSIHKTDHKPWNYYYTDDQKRWAESVFAADLELYQRAN